MCPSCFAAAATLVTGVSSAAGLTALLVTLVGRRQGPAHVDRVDHMSASEETIHGAAKNRVATRVARRS
jgi:hypothetical protein